VPKRKLGFFVKIKEGENFNHPDLKTIGTGTHTLNISRINPPKFDGGLNFYTDLREIVFAFHGAGADIGKKNCFRSGPK
jgi:hypothetical protein